MRILSATLVLSALSLGAAGSASAQGAPARQPVDTSAKRSSRAGVYTAAQAERGAEVYAGFCQSCHTASSHTGVTFANWWRGRTLADLFGYVSTQMPKNDPGGLDAAQYADVVAYLLRMNAMPAGKAELPADAVALAAIRIDVPAAKAAAPAGAKSATPVRKSPR